ncbi:MAG: FxsA family protein, partial [Gammaproteobacteria bacterium]
MAPWLVIFFLTPIVEMYLLIEVGGTIGTLPTIALVMLTAVIGVALLRRQGLATLTRGLGRLQRGEVPAQEMAEGILLAISGALLLTPGFVTDAVGFTFLLPASRVVIARRLLAKVTIIGAQSAAG